MYKIFGLICFLFFSSVFAGEKKVCLTMIVKNESKIIERCLNSAKDVIDCVSICDTGSDDNTVAIIEEFLKKNNLKGTVHHHEWVNFGHNRSLSIKAAQKTLENLKMPLEDSYLLLLDADMVLESSPQFKKTELDKDAYYIAQKTAYDILYNIRLAKASLPWKSVGVTHEYWSAGKVTKDEQIDTIYINDKYDGGCRSDKFERDVRLLTQGLKDEPENSRYMFYLAQSYQALNQYEDAIKWFKARIAKGGWFEEVWYSKYMIGKCHQLLGDWNGALANYLDAYEFNPTRSESLREISRYYRENSHHNLAYFFAKLGSTVPFPKNQRLFLTYPVYDYLFDEDISISAYYTPHKKEGFEASNRLLLKRSVPDHLKNQAFSNTLFYLENLKNVKYTPIEIDLPFVKKDLATRYNPTNPTILKTKNGYDVILRTVNYLQMKASDYQSLDLDAPGKINTKNFLIRYDKNLNLISQNEIIENLNRPKYENNITGLEDCRIFALNGSTWFSCTTLDTNPCGKPQISICKLNDRSEKNTIEVEKLIPIFGSDPNRCEKNWLPYVINNELHFIYSFDPFTIYKPAIDFKNNSIVKMDKIVDSPKNDLSRFSGSAAPIKFQNGYLALVHEHTSDQKGRTYMHRFVYFDNDFHIQKISKPFVFMHKGIEYCCGMTIDHADKNLIMTIGIEDRQAYFATLPLSELPLILEPLP